MKIRSKVFLVVVVLSGLLFLGTSQLFTKLESRNIGNLEQESAQENISRVQSVLEGKFDELTVKLSDWSAWDDSYQFVQDSNSQYLESNLQDSTLAQLRLNFILIENNEGNVIFKNYRNSQGKTSFPEDIEKIFQQQKVLSIGKTKPLASISGIIASAEGPFVVAVQPITSSDASADPRGIFVFGYAIDQEFANNFSKITISQIHFSNADGAAQGDFGEAQKKLNLRENIYISENPQQDHIASYVLIPDIFGKPGLIVESQTPRNIHTLGFKNMQRMNYFLLGISAFEIVLILVLFEFFVLRKISRLAEGVKQIGHGAKEAGRLDTAGSDEFSELGREINAMLDSLDNAREEKKESEQRFLNIADTAPVMIWVADENGRIIYVNIALTKFLGKTEEELFGDAWTGVIHDEDKQRVLNEYKEGQDKREPLSLRYRVQTANGEYRWIRVDAVVRKTKSGVFKGYIGTAIEEK